MAAGLLEEADLDGRADDLARPDRPAGRVGQRARGRREPAAGPAFDALRRRRGGGGRGGGRPEGVVVGVREEEVAPLEGGRRRGEGEEGDRVGERGRQDERRGRGHRCCCCGGGSGWLYALAPLGRPSPLRRDTRTLLLREGVCYAYPLLTPAPLQTASAS